MIPQFYLAAQQEVSDIKANAEAMLQENDLNRNAGGFSYGF